MRTDALVLVGTVFLSAVVSAEQPPIRVYIPGDVTVITSDSLRTTFVSVNGRSWRDDKPTAEKEFGFCITHTNPLGAKLSYQGRGRVIYRLPRSKTSAAKARPEQILPALAVLLSSGETWFFLAEDQGYPHPPNERSVGALTTFVSTDVSRQDYVDRAGRRRGTAPSSCVANER